MIGSYLHAIRRRWLMIPAALLVAIGVLVLMLNLSVTATARVVVIAGSDQNVHDYEGFARSLSVARAVLRETHIRGTTSEALLQHVSVTQETGTNIVEISVDAPNRSEALRLCAAWVTETNALYNRLNTTPAQVAFASAIQSLNKTQQKINSLQEQITAFEYAHPELVSPQATASAGVPAGDAIHGATTVGGSSSSKVTGTLKQEQDAAHLANLQQDLAGQQMMYAQLAQALSAGQAGTLVNAQPTGIKILDPATIAPKDVAGLATVAVLLALLAGSGLIFTWERFNRSIHSSRALERVYAGANIAVMSISPRPRRRELRRVAPAAWALPSAFRAEQRPGHWPAMLALAALTGIAGPIHTPQSDETDGCPESSRPLAQRGEAPTAGPMQ